MTLLLSLLALSCLLWRLRARRRSEVSQRWLAALRRQSTRVEFHGVRVHKPWK